MAAKNKEYQIRNWSKSDRLFSLYRSQVETVSQNMLDEDSGKIIPVVKEVQSRRFEKYVHVPPNLKNGPPAITTVDGETMQRLLEDPHFKAALEAEKQEERVSYKEV